MSLINIETVLTSTPVKRIKYAYSQLKENGLTEEGAQEFYDIYSKEPVSAIVECYREILSEPYLGADYFKETVCEPSSCLFLSYDTILESVRGFISEIQKKVGPKQIKIYDSVKTTLENTIEDTKATKLLASYITKENPEFESTLSSLNSEEEVFNLFKDASVVECVTYMPYIAKDASPSLNVSLFENVLGGYISEKVETEEEWGYHVEMVTAINKLATDKAYMEAVANIPSEFKNIIIGHLGVNLNDELTEMTKVDVQYIESPADPQMSVNNIFFMMQEAAMYSEDYNESKEKIARIKAIAYEMTSDLISMEDTGDIDHFSGYSLIDESMSVEDALASINNKYQEYSSVFESEEDEDIPDPDDEPEAAPVGGNDGKKPQAPKAKNLANKIQNKAMDKEVQHNKKVAVRRQKGQEIVNAADAATRVPREAIRSAKEMVRKLDEMDDERRKNYLTEPGFRKKAFRNLKLAILYGGAAYTKLTFVPVVMMARHFSKKKNIRMMNELARELNTEIKVTEAKIEDANANEDKTEKYRLMRIRDRLEAELTRVQTNSQYV